MSNLCQLVPQTSEDACGWNFKALKVTKRQLNCLLLSLSALLLFILSSTQVYAQMDTSTIRGTVSDASGAMVSGAAVVITDLKTNRTFTTKTNAAGEYYAPSLGVSSYKLSFTKSGFKTSTIDGIVLHANETLAENAVLNVGAEEQIVEVHANVIQVDTDSGSLGGTITSDQVAKLPLNGRDFTSLMALIPGAMQSGDNTSNNETLGGFISGQNGANMLVDGTDATRVDSNTSFSTFGRGNARITRTSVDNIEEVKVSSGPYSAEYGRAIGEIINVITKSGSNQVHGEGFEYFRNDALDAKNYFYKGTAVPLRLNQYGGNLGGAAIKDKLFFFANYEGERQRVTQLSDFYSQVLNDKMRALAVPAMEPIVSKIPHGNGGPAPTVNGIKYSYWFDRLDGSTYSDINENTYGLKMDYVLSSKNNFAVRYNYNFSDTYGTYGLAIGQKTDAIQLSQLGKATWNYTGSSTFLNEAGFAVNSPHSHQTAGEPGLPSIGCFLCFSPSVGFGVVPNPTIFPSKQPHISYNAIDTATKIVGRNEFRFGFDIRWNDVGSELTSQDSMTFGGGPKVDAAAVLPCDSATPAPAGCVDASGGPEGFLADTGGASWSRLGYPMTHLKNTMMGFFLNDDWKVRHNLTLNLGLRYDHNTVIHDPSHSIQNFNLATLSLNSGRTALYQPSYVDFAPRLGFSWDPTSKGKTSIKGGFGLFFLPIPAGQPMNLRANTEENFSINVLQIAFLGYTCTPALTIQYPLNPTPPNCTSGALNMTSFDPHQRDSYSEQWSLTLEQELVKNTVLNITYRGNRGLRMANSTNQNSFNPNDPIPVVKGGNSDPSAKHRYLSDSFASINLNTQQANSQYNAFNVSIRTNTHGLSLQGNYNYSRMYDDYMGLFESYQNPRNFKADWARSDGDVRNNFSFGGVYDVPRIPKFPAKLGNGWQLTALVQGRAGTLINFGYTDNSDNAPAAEGRRPDCTGISPRALHYSKPNNQINIAAFAADAGNFGTCPRNYGQGPGFIQPDLGLVKNTKLTEHVTWEFRGEFFDILNHPNFSNPGTSISSSGTGHDKTLSPGLFFGASGNTLGNLVGIGTSRQIQFSTKIIF